MAVNIRSMLKKDKPVLMAILRDTPEFRPAEVTVAEEVIDACLNDSVNSGYYILVAEDGSGIAGYVCYGPTPLTSGTWDLYWIAIARDKRGEGIGSALIRAAERESRKAKGRMAVIETSSQPMYADTKRFYLSHGYRVIARIPDFYSPGDDKLILQKLLG